MRFLTFAPVATLAALAAAAPIVPADYEAFDHVNTEAADNSNHDQILPLAPLIGPALTYGPVVYEGVKQVVKNGPRIVDGAKKVFSRIRGGSAKGGKAKRHVVPQAYSDVDSEVADNSNHDQALSLGPIFRTVKKYGPQVLETTEQVVTHGPSIVDGVKQLFGGNRNQDGNTNQGGNTYQVASAKQASSAKQGSRTAKGGKAKRDFVPHASYVQDVEYVNNFSHDQALPIGPIFSTVKKYGPKILQTTKKYGPEIIKEAPGVVHTIGTLFGDRHEQSGNPGQNGQVVASGRVAKGGRARRN
ncbi:hypothetical protein GGI12_005469 [Dipsacomyces acuminosporus]|nr:hypothetical protein GGI12_005469 [Dipsacomyces acuminosporus]